MNDGQSKVMNALAAFEKEVTRSLFAGADVGTDSALTADKLATAIMAFDRDQRPSLLGVRIIENTALADTILDTSGCRSPSRAIRRWNRGIKGRTKMVIKPWTHAYKLPNGSWVMHPTMAALVKRQIGQSPEQMQYF